MMSLQESVEKCLKFYGDNIDTSEAKKDAFSRFGYNVWSSAVEKYYFNKAEHIVPEKYKEQQEKEAANLAGIATSKTRLTF